MQRPYAIDQKRKQYKQKLHKNKTVKMNKQNLKAAYPARLRI